MVAKEELLAKAEDVADQVKINMLHYFELDKVLNRCGEKGRCSSREIVGHWHCGPHHIFSLKGHLIRLLI